MIRPNAARQSDGVDSDTSSEEPEQRMPKKRESRSKGRESPKKV